jgi:hypothetical protein
MKRIVLSAFELVGVLMAVNAVAFLVIAVVSDATYALKVFLLLSMLWSAVMMIVGPSLLFRSQTPEENKGTVILVAGGLLFALTLFISLAAP